VGAVRLPDEHWANYEEDVDSLTAFVEAVEKIAAFQAKTDTRFVWRGVAGASWALHSPIVRRFKEKHGHVPTEDELRELEQEILKEAREWALDWHSAGGRLTSLELLAALQHYAAPTRMIDFTFNAFVALWFAVEKNDNEPGRVFAVDIAGRTVTRAEASAAEPWWLVPGLPRAEWRRKSWVWRPPPFEPRIVRQDGCFLMGGIPSTTPARRITGYEDPMRAHEVLECMSVPFNLIKFEQARAAAEGRALRGTPPDTRAFTLTVSNKAAIRTDLERAFGYSHASIYPDFPGFAEHARSVPPPVPYGDRTPIASSLGEKLAARSAAIVEVGQAINRRQLSLTVEGDKASH
jgi:FRG domain